MYVSESACQQTEAIQTQKDISKYIYDFISLNIYIYYINIFFSYRHIPMKLEKIAASLPDTNLFTNSEAETVHS